jgi:hypothetical protein
MLWAGSKDVEDRIWPVGRPLGRCRKTNVGEELNVTRQFLAYGGDVNLLRDNINTVKKNSGTLIDVSKEVCQEINIENKYMLLSHHQNAGQNYNVKIANRLFENVSQFRYL